MPTTGYRSADWYRAGRRLVRERGLEVVLGVGAGLAASAVLAFLFLGGASSPGSVRGPGPVAAVTPAPSGLSPLMVPSGSIAPASAGAIVVPGAATQPAPGTTTQPAPGAATDPPPAVAGHPPAPPPTPVLRPPATRPPGATAPPAPASQSPPPPTAEPPPPTAEPPPSPEPTAAPDVTSGPKRAVRDFYAAVENHLWGTATDLWTTSMQERYPPQEYIVDRFIDTTRIDITYIETVSRGDGQARVEVALTEYRLLDPARTLVGAWDLLKVDGGWLLDVPYF
jgi:hypothetical protein